MAALAAVSGDIDPSCAICGAPPFPECPHESERLELALDQAQQRWDGIQSIREWVLNHARAQVLSTFHHLRTARYHTHLAYLQSLPCFTLYHRYNGAPPIHPTQLHALHAQIAQANLAFRHGVDEDWRRSCLRYPEVLDYYFGLVGWRVPAEGDKSVCEPVFGGAGGGGTRAAGREGARAEKWIGAGGGGGGGGGPEKRGKKERRRSRGVTPPALPRAPMPGVGF